MTRYLSTKLKSRVPIQGYSVPALEVDKHVGTDQEV